MNYEYGLPSSKNHSKNTFPLLKQVFHYRIFVNACAVPITIPIYCFIQLWIFFSTVHCYLCISNFAISVFDFSLSLRFSASLKINFIVTQIVCYICLLSETFLKLPFYLPYKQYIMSIAKGSKANRPFSITTVTALHS